MTWTFLAIAFLICALAVGFAARPFFGTNSMKSIIGLAIGLPAFCIAIYVFLGSPGLQNSDSSQQAGTPVESNTTTGKVASVASMLDGLASRLSENPDDGKGWLLLSRSYEHLGQTDDAIAAYAKAADLGEYDAELAALAASGSAPSETPISSARISGSVDVTERAAKLIEPTDTVFIFARASGVAGVPAAVLRQPASGFPIRFELDDSLAMVEGIKLSDFDTVDVTARISRDGNAMEALRSLETKSTGIAVGDESETHLIIE